MWTKRACIRNLSEVKSGKDIRHGVLQTAFQAFPWHCAVDAEALSSSSYATTGAVSNSTSRPTHSGIIATSRRGYELGQE